MREDMREDELSIGQNQVVLLCPHCGGTYLHHGKVSIYEREEDQDNGLHVSVERGGTLSVDQDLSGNPSLRRHGLTIQFWCEICKANPELTIVQHKGQTFVQFQ